jgi:dihydroorotate dehydrogenase
MIYNGLSLAPAIAEGLDGLLARDGFSNVAEAVGIEKENYK